MRTQRNNRPARTEVNNIGVMLAISHNIISVVRHGKDWMCQLKNGMRVRVTDTLLMQTAQLGK